MFLVIKADEGIFAIFQIFDRDFGPFGIGIAQIRLQIRSRRPRNRLDANFVNLAVINWHVFFIYLYKHLNLGGNLL